MADTCLVCIKPGGVPHSELTFHNLPLCESESPTRSKLCWFKFCLTQDWRGKELNCLDAPCDGLIIRWQFVAGY